MAAVTTELKVLVKAVGKGEVDKLSKSLTDLGKKAAAPANKQFRELSLELKKIQRNSTQSISNLRGYRNAWRDISEQVKIGSREFEVARLKTQSVLMHNCKRLVRLELRGFLGRIGRVRGLAHRSLARLLVLACLAALKALLALALALFLVARLDQLLVLALALKSGQCDKLWRSRGVRCRTQQAEDRAERRD